MRHATLLSFMFVALSSFVAPSARAQAPTTAPKPAPKLTKAPKVVRFVEAPYPETAKAEGSTTVVLRIRVTAEGTVDEAEVTESAGADFDRAAVAAVKAFLFEPAEVDGKPASIRILYRYTFTLKVEAPKTASFEGTVRDRTSQKPLEGVEVVLDSGARATTDARGGFRIDGVPPGPHVVTIAGREVTAVRTEETFEAGKTVAVAYDVSAPPPATAGASGDDLEIVVTAPALEKRVVSTTITAEEGRRLPGTQGDVLKVVESMPGVARAQVGSGALVVWGAAPEDTRVYVDGVRVPRLYHNGGLRSVIATDLVESVELAPGGWGATYGRGLGGLVTVKTRKSDAKELHGSAALDVLDAQLAIRAPVTDKLRVAIAGRRSHLDAVLSPFKDDASEDFFPIPRYEDAQVRVSYEIDAHERVDLTGLHSSDRIARTVGSNDPLLAREDTRVSAFQRIYARWEKDTARGTVTVTPWFGLDRSRVENRFGDVPTSVESRSTLYGLRAAYRGRATDVLTVTVGVDLEAEDARIERRGSVTSPAREGDVRVFGQVPQDRVNADGWNVAAIGLAPFGELDLALFDGKVHLVPGARFDPYFVSVSRKTPVEGETPAVGSFREDAAIEPRLAALWQATPRVLVRAAYGRYHQPARGEDLSAVFGNPLLRAASADHFLTGAQFRLFPKTTLETTLFLTEQANLAARSPASAPALAEALVPIGEGRSYGVQTLLRQELARHVSGWVSYAITRSERKDTPDGPWRLSDYDQSHVLSAVGSWDLGRGFEVGARARFATGFPRTPVVGALYDSRRDVFQPVFGGKNTDRIPSFFQLDLRGSKRFVLPHGELEAYVEVQNVTSRENPEEVVYSPSYRDRGYITGLPILPILGARYSL